MLSSAELVELERAECLRLLAGGSVGRVVFTDAAMPAALPVNDVFEDAEVVFRTARSGRLATTAPGNVVAFEVDDIEVSTRTGWSVLGVGEAYEVRDPAARGPVARAVSPGAEGGRGVRTAAVAVRAPDPSRRGHGQGLVDRTSSWGRPSGR